MKYSDQTYNLRIELDTKDCELSANEITRLERALEPLRKPVEKFPVSALYITIEYHHSSNDYRVKTVLQLPGRGLATGDLAEQYYPAFERCVRKLIHKLTAYEAQLDNDEERSKHLKGTHHLVLPDTIPDLSKIEKSIEDNDYEAFRNLLWTYEDPLRKRIGRWIQRYPTLDAQVGERFELADVVEEVFLNAFERFRDRPNNVPLGIWLRQLIDPSLRQLSRHTLDELEIISFTRSARSGTE